MKYHFISGLPRSGSTLLAALLRQNPRFHAGMSSPVASIVMKMQTAVSRGTEGANFITDGQRKRLLRGIFANYYSGTEKKIIFDTNRAWCSKLPLLVELFPESRIVCMVRDVMWVLNSFEKLVQANPLELSGIYNFNPGGTVFSRTKGLADAEGAVGYAINALREAYSGPFAKRLFLIDFEALVRAPEQAMRHLYTALGEPYFEHDFDNFEYEEQDFDAALGAPGLHSVHGPVRWRTDNLVLPPDLAQLFINDSFWKNPKFNTRGVPTILYREGGNNGDPGRNQPDNRQPAGFDDIEPYRNLVTGSNCQLANPNY